jgi:hypothetical protein
MKRKPRKSIFTLVIFFILTTVFFITSQKLLDKWGADSAVLLSGNAILFLITTFSFFISKRGLLNQNPHAFLRGVYLGIMIKLFLCIIAAFIYISIYKTAVNKPALFTLMGLYLVYTFIEISLLTRMLRRKTNA